MTATAERASPAIALFLPSLDGGGAERVFVELANEFAERGLRVDLVLATADGPFIADVSAQVRVVDLKASRMLNALPTLVRYLRAERPAAMLSGLDHANVVAILASRLARGATRCVISLRSVPTEVHQRAQTFGSRVLLRFMKSAYPLADAIIANSQAVALDVSQLLKMPVNDVNVVHNPLNLARIEQQSREPVEHAWCAPGAPPIVLGVGSLAMLKDFATLIAAFAIVRSRRECRLVILGEGPERERLDAAARRAGVAGDVAMPGFIANPFAWMRHARVFASSSLTEGCPNALMQALAVGVPIVSTDTGGSPELLEQGRWGKLVRAGAPGAMAEAIAECLDAGSRVDTRARAGAFSHDRIARKFLEVLLPAAGSGNAA